MRFIFPLARAAMPGLKRSRLLIAWVCAGLLLSTPLGAQIRSGGLPSLGDDAEMTLGAERRLGERIAREIYRDPDYIDDPLLSEYVDQIWKKLLASARERGELTAELNERFAWEIMMGRDRSVNAFALPGGFLGLHLGLIGLMTTRDELAAVLAHELSHVTQRHVSRLMAKEKQQMPWIIGAMILGAMAAAKRPDAAGAIVAGGQAIAIQGQLNFSRDMEREADRIGFGVLEQAGYATRGFTTMFDKLQLAARLNDYGAYPYLRTHPLTTERIADMSSRDHLGQADRPAPVSDAEHLMMASRARALSEQGVENLRSLVAEVDAARFDGLSAPRQAALLYQAALASNRLNDAARANGFAARLAPIARGNPSAHRLAELLRVELLLAATGPAGAGPERNQSAEQMLASQWIKEGAGRRPELLAAGNLLLRAGRADEVAQRLRSWVAEHPRDAAAWGLLAMSQHAQGFPLRGIRADAEAHVARYDYAGAVERFKAAQELIKKTAGGTAFDHLEASIIDVRARQVATLAREQALER